MHNSTLTISFSNTLASQRPLLRPTFLKWSTTSWLKSTLQRNKSYHLLRQTLHPLSRPCPRWIVFACSEIQVCPLPVPIWGFIVGLLSSGWLDSMLTWTSTHKVSLSSMFTTNWSMVSSTLHASCRCSFGASGGPLRLWLASVCRVLVACKAMRPSHQCVVAVCEATPLCLVQEQWLVPIVGSFVALTSNPHSNECSGRLPRFLVGPNPALDTCSLVRTYHALWALSVIWQRSVGCVPTRYLPPWRSLGTSRFSLPGLWSPGLLHGALGPGLLLGRPRDPPPPLLFSHLHVCSSRGDGSY